jgi:hypothetical protein
MSLDTDKVKAAIVVATAMAEKVKTAYIESVKNNLASYDGDYMPDEMDFFAFVEGFDWSKV